MDARSFRVLQRAVTDCRLRGRDVRKEPSTGSGAEHSTYDHGLHAQQRRCGKQRHRERYKPYRRYGGVFQRDSSDISGEQRDADCSDGARGSYQREDLGGDVKWGGEFGGEFFGDTAGAVDLEFFAHERGCRDKRQRRWDGVHGRDGREI